MTKGKLGFNQNAIEYYTPKSLVDMFGRELKSKTRNEK